MANCRLHDAVQHLRRAALQGGAGLTDGQLLECFITHHDDAAFEAIMRRHGAMVLGVCRRLLRHEQDAEDAFQATFLVLARKAASVTPRELLANWLYGVACKTATKARGLRAKRRSREQQVPVMPDPAAIQHDDHGAAWQPLIDRELNRLPEKYRLPVILCDLEGKTRKAAAQQLGWPEGTVSSRLARARELLARRLAKYGLGTSAESLAVILLHEASSSGLPTALVASTVKAAGGMATSQTMAAGVVSAEVVALAERVVNSMFLSRVTTVAAVVLMAVAFTTGTGAILTSAGGTDPQDVKAAVPVPADKQDKQDVVTANHYEIINVYAANVALADEKYMGKRVTVTGTMRRITRVPGGGGYAVQMYYPSVGQFGERGRGQASPPIEESPILAFVFGDESRQQLANLEVNQSLTIEGDCVGMSTGTVRGPEVIRFDNCKIVKVENQ